MSLEFFPDGSGRLMVQTLNSESDEPFQWILSSAGDELSIIPKSNESFVEGLMYDKPYKVEIQVKGEWMGAPDEQLVLSAWHEAKTIEAPQGLIEFSEGWASAYFRHKMPKKD